MSGKRDPRIDAYLAKAAPFAQPILRHLRDLVHEACPTVTETLKWGHPSFLHGDKILCGMASFKAHCTFGFWHQEMEKVIGRDGEKAATAMGSLGRITAPSDLPDDQRLLAYLRRAAELIASGAPARPSQRRGPAKELNVPTDLLAALKKNKQAAQAFAAFAPSHRNEYVEWITEAKRAETREKRLATTVEWLVEGKSRNWKYANC